MATTNNKSKNLVDLIIENQSLALDQVIETSKKLTKDLPMVNETIDKGHTIYKEVQNKTKGLFEDTSKMINETTNKMNENSENTNKFFEQWYENQINWTKGFMNTSNFSSDQKDWLKNWQNLANQNNMQWMNTPFFQMFNSNAFATLQSKMSEGLNQWSQYTKYLLDFMNSNQGDWWNKFSNLTAADSYNGMNQMNESLVKFYELWIPMFKSIQDKNFNLLTFQQLLNPEKYKEFVDKFFHFMPDGSKTMLEQFNQSYVQYMKQLSESGLNNFKSPLQNNPWSNSNPFSQLMEQYSSWKNSIQESVSPLSKLLADNSSVKQAKIWNEVYDQIMQYNIKNNELQYMMYQHGIKVMDKVALKVSDKLQNGESIDSIIKIFQDWLMTSDEIFGELFQSESYSKLMTEVSSLQLKIKQKIDLQLESSFLVNLPVATRSEMDEVYKSIYDLKKMYRQLEKSLKTSKSEDFTSTQKK